MTNLRSLSELFRAARKLAAVCAFATVMATAAAGQTNTFPNSGNAGIGTTSPVDALQIVKDNGGLTLDTATSGTIVPVFRFSTTGTGRASIQYRPDLPGLAFQTGGIAYPAQNRMVLTDSGNVGIGTATPGGTLSVVGTSAAVEAHILNNSATGYQALRFGVDSASPTGAVLGHFNGSFSTSGAYIANGSYLAGYGPGGLTLGTEHASGAVNFFTGGSAAANQRMIITSSGNVGIGTATPKTKLDIKQSEDTFVGGLHIRRATTNDTWALATGSDNSLYMGYATNASGADAGSDFTVYPLVLTGGGNVGIGTAGPGYKLDVQGGQINSSGGLCIAGDCKTSWSQVGGGGSSQWTGTSSIYYNGGNVGIGTTTPSDPLQIDGPAGWALRLRYPGNGVYLRMSANQVSAYNSSGVGSDLFLNVDGGKVGIGTTTPASTLQIGAQTAGATGTPVTLSLGGSFSNSAGNNFKIRLYDDATPANTYGIGVSWASMDFGVGSTAGYNWYSGGTHRMTLNGSGNAYIAAPIG